MPNTAGATIRKLPIRSARMSSAICRLERHAATRATDIQVDRKHARVPPAASQPRFTKCDRLWAMTKYSYDIFSSQNSRFSRDLSSVAGALLRQLSRVVALTSTSEKTGDERARPTATSAPGCRRPPWVRSFCRRASSTRMREQVRLGFAARVLPVSQRASVSAFSHPLTKPRPVPRAARATRPSRNARRRPRAPQGSERCPRGPVAEHARGTRSPRRSQGDGPADPPRGHPGDQVRVRLDESDVAAARTMR